MPKRRKPDAPSQEILLERDDDLVCGACLLPLFAREHLFLGVPTGCPHLFHWDCLTIWASMQNTCPQCKNRFVLAGKYRSSDREFIETVRFRKSNRLSSIQDSESVEEDLPIEVCEKCNEPGPDESFILCDGMDYTCNAMYHFKCVGYSSVPQGLWFCPDCVSKGYIPNELKTTSKKTRDTSPRGAPYRPQIFPRNLVVHPGARRQSSALPRGLHQPVTLTATAPPIFSTSVFARFRQRRLERTNPR